MRCFATACLLIATMSASPAAADDWTGFRGPGGSATSEAADVPVEFSAESGENVLWKTELPGPGTSSPITIGDRIYLTAYSGYGLEPNEGSDENLMRHVTCLDRKSGSIRWTKDFEPRLPESKYSGGNSSRHGYASSTPASDGERLYIFFGKSGVYCLDMDGDEIWHTLVGDGTNGWGSANSPVLYKNLVIINASVESRSLVALDKSTGDEVWKAERQIKGSWNTPILAQTADGKTELVVSLPEEIVAFDPATGEELWHAGGIPDGGYVCPSLIAHEGIVYAIGGRKNTAIAVKTGGRGDVGDSHVLWETGKGSNVSSPVYHDGYIYWVHEGRGAAYCLNAENGDVEFEERLEPRPGLVYSSVTLAGDKLFALSQENGVYVIAAEPRFELLAHNELDAARGNACIVVDGDRLLIRNDRYLYCIGKK